MMDLILYNYCIAQISQEVAYEYLTDLLLTLRSEGAHVDSIRFQRGNDSYPDTYKLIGKILDFWYIRQKAAEPTQHVRSSFYFLQHYLSGRDTDSLALTFDFSHDSGLVRAQLIALIEHDNTPPAFFHSILITGSRYTLEAPYGVALSADSDVGGISVNANVARESIWHETAHLLGANDHYDSSTKSALPICRDPSGCLMRWNSLDGSEFCSQSIAEMNEYLSGPAR